VGVPSAADRSHILRTLLSQTGIREGLEGGVSSAAISSVAANGHGMVGADLLLLCKRAYLAATIRESSDVGTLALQDPSLPLCDAVDSARHPLVIDADLYVAAKAVRPSALREAAVEVPTVRWTDVGGMVELKSQLQEVQSSVTESSLFMTIDVFLLL